MQKSINVFSKTGSQKQQICYDIKNQFYFKTVKTIAKCFEVAHSTKVKLFYNYK